MCRRSEKEQAVYCVAHGKAAAVLVGPGTVERLFPVPDGLCEHDEKQSFGPGIWWALDLTAEDDQLLSQQCIFGDEFGFVRARSVRIPVREARLFGRVQCNKRCWIQMNECWDRHVSAMSRAATMVGAPSKREVRDKSNCLECQVARIGRQGV